LSATTGCPFSVFIKIFPHNHQILLEDQ
jgi:hypothetical protein